MSSENSQRLLPCPFCGDSATLTEQLDDRGAWVECGNADCEAFVALNTKEQAIAAWNRRVG